MLDKRKGYNIGVDTQLILYGYNNMAVKLYEKMTEDGYKVSMFVDKRAKELENSVGVKIVDIDNVKLEHKPERYALVIMLYNAVQHDDIAKMFNDKYDIDKIIYVPMADINEDDYSNILRNKYNDFINGEYDKLVGIPYYENGVLAYENNLDLDNIGEYVDVMINSELVYTEKNPQKIRSQYMKKYADIPVCALEPYKQLFRYFSGTDHDVDLYFNVYYEGVSDKKPIMLHRKMLYDVYVREINKGMEFFKTSAPIAIWNDRGYFNLLEGHHRSVFLLERGMTQIPVRLSKEDYIKLYNIDVLKKVCDYISNNNIVKFKTHIAHPFFDRFSSEIENFGPTILWRIFEYIGGEKFAGKTVLDMSLLDGYFARNATRMQADSVTCLVKDNKKFVELIDCLMRIRGINLVDLIDNSNQYDVVFIGECNSKEEVMYGLSLSRERAFVHIKDKTLKELISSMYECIELKSYVHDLLMWTVYVVEIRK